MPQSTRLNSDQTQTSLRSLPALALRETIQSGYTRTDLRKDVMAGLVVGIVALPLSMALSIAVGAPPQNGLYTAIVAGLLVAAMGGSRTQVTGPTAAFVVILAPINARFGMGGLLMSGLLAGLMLVGMGLFRLGRLIEFIPHPVTTGFTAGIAVVIATLQIKDLFGLQLATNPDHYFERVEAMWAARGTVSLAELGVGLFTLALLVLLPRLQRRVPAPLLALPAAALLALALHALFSGFEVSTIASRFTSKLGDVVVHGIPQLPPLPLLPWNMPGANGEPFDFSFATFRALLPGAFAIAMLGAIESLLSAVVADGMAGTRHDPDAEILSLGLGNVVTPFFGGIPATGALARTATNIRSGGRSPVASMVHAVTVLLAVLLLAPLLGYLPMASLAALLLLVAWNMSEAKHFVKTARIAPRSDVAVLITCFGLTVAFDMVVGVTAGMMLAALLFMRRMADVTEAKLVAGPEAQLAEPLPERVMIYRISGPLFFGAAQKAMSALNRISGTGSRALILDLEGVRAMDATGLVALESALDQLKRKNCLGIIAGVNWQPLSVLKKAGLDRREGVMIFTDKREAMEAARKHVAAEKEAVAPAPAIARAPSEKPA